MKNTRVARRYAMALMAAATDEQTIDRTGADLDLIGQILRDSREFRMLVASPVISAEKKAEVFRALLGPHVTATTLAFVQLMTAKGRAALLHDVVEQFRVLRDEHLGIVSVDVKSAVEISPVQQQDLTSRMERYTQKKVRVRFSLDTQIKGGLVVRIGDTVLDASLRRQLELLRTRLSAGGPLTN